MNILINGFEAKEGEFPLQTTLRGLYETQKAERVNIQFWKTFKEWREQKLVFQVLRTKVGRVMVFGMVCLILNSLTHPFGFDWNIQSIVKALKLIP